MFGGSGLPRLASLLTLLVVLGILTFRAREPAPSRSVAQPTRSARVSDPAAPADRRSPGNSETFGQSGGSVGRPATALETVTPGPTDEDPEQQQDAREEFQVVSDGTLGIRPEEMFAYGRLLQWTEHQSFEDLARRRPPEILMTDLMQTPEQYRGRLVAVDLNVLRVLEYAVPDRWLGMSKLYEIWGWSDEAKAWLYCVVTAHPPPGLPVGPAVEDRVRCVGYFFKLQGYYEAGAKPRAAPLRAPLLVGRLRRYAAPVAAHVSGIDGWSIGLVAGVTLVLLIGILAQTQAIRRRRDRQVVRQQEASAAVQHWLRDGQAIDHEVTVAADVEPALLGEPPVARSGGHDGPSAIRPG